MSYFGDTFAPLLYFYRLFVLLVGACGLLAILLPSWHFGVVATSAGAPEIA